MNVELKSGVADAGVGLSWAHAIGSIIAVNGSYVHRLDPRNCSVIVERRLPVDRSHNGLLALSDGSFITDGGQLGGGLAARTTATVARISWA